MIYFLKLYDIQSYTYSDAILTHCASVCYLGRAMWQCTMCLDIPAMCHSDTIALSYLMLGLEYFPQQLSFNLKE